MSKRVSINIDKEIERKIRKLQSRLIGITKEELTYSYLVNTILLVGLKNIKTKKS